MDTVAKKRTRKNTKVQRAIVGVSLEEVRRGEAGPWRKRAAAEARDPEQPLAPGETDVAPATLRGGGALPAAAAATASTGNGLNTPRPLGVATPPGPRRGSRAAPAIPPGRG